MDAESQELVHGSRQSADLEQDHNSSVHHIHQPDAHCVVCSRSFQLETEANEGFEAIHMCRDCKIIVLNDQETNVARREIHRRRLWRRRTRQTSSESVEDLFLQEFSQLINMERQNSGAHLESDSSIPAHQRAGYNNRSRSRRWRRALSDNDSDGLDHMDSSFAESDSNFSFSVYGGESDASLDRHSLADRETFIQLDDELHMNSDTDIDPMHAGLDQWNSDDQDEDDGEWEEVDVDEEAIPSMEQDNRTQDANGSPILNRAWVRWRARRNRRLRYPNIFGDLEELEMPPYIGNSGDYLDARGFEELLEQLAETDSSRRGAPPAAASFVNKLLCMVISKDHEKNGSLICAVCKDPLIVGTEANQLPCSHFYHPSCILPWLSARNSCPVCRYELPTDDPDYEDEKRNLHSGRMVYDEIQQQDHVEESLSSTSSDLEADEAHEFNYRRAEQIISEDVNHDQGDSNREGRGGRWLFLSAAPIVSVVGVVLVLWLRGSLVEGRSHSNFGRQDARQLQRSSQNNPTPGSEGSRGRRWWSLF